MFASAARALRAINSTCQLIEYEPSEDSWRSIKMGVKRDLQARRIRPNVGVPARRHPIQYLGTMYRETGSVTKTIASFLHDGAWTSSGGSFKLAEKLGYDFQAEIEKRLADQRRCRFIEIGGAWAGFHEGTGSAPNGIAGLAQRFPSALNRQLHLEFTNLTPWHESLPAGVREHAHVTAAMIGALTKKGVAEGSADIIYSQAAAYFETDPASFVKGAAGLLKPGGLLLFNYREENAQQILRTTSECGLACQQSVAMGGMNGIVSAFHKEQAHVRKPVRLIQEEVRLPSYATA